MKRWSLFKNLELDKKGIYVSKNKQQPVSYPKKGNVKCFEVEDSSFWFKHRNNCILSVIKKNPPHGVIIDLGGGNGYVTKRLLDEGFKTILMEPGYTGALIAKRQRKIPQVISSTLENADFPKESLDAICMFDVLEHIKHDTQILNHIHKVLKPNGLIYITVPTHKFLWSNHDVQAGHYRRYSQKSINKLFNTKFKILYSSYFFQPLIIPILVFRVMPFYLRFIKNRPILSRKAEHGSKNNFISKIVSYFLNNELKAIKQGKTINTGTSLILVGQKIK